MNTRPDFTFNCPKSNFRIQIGENLHLNFRVKKTILNRIKWWFASKFFPFEIVWWDKE